MGRLLACYGGAILLVLILTEGIRKRDGAHSYIVAASAFTSFLPAAKGAVCAVENCNARANTAKRRAMRHLVSATGV